MFEGIRQADIVLDACGREIAPPGYKFVDLPYYIPLKATFTPASAVPFQIRAKNNALTEFRCRGIIFECSAPVRVRWPNGRYLSQNPSWPNSAGSPIGSGDNLIALNVDVDIPSGANITVEVSA
jgi:hypothetical protein